MMTESTKTNQPDSAPQTEAVDADEPITPLPLRPAEEDPSWAVRTVWTWVGIALFLLVFILVLLTLGIWYD